MSDVCFAPVPALRRELMRELQLGGLRFTDSWHGASTTIARHAHRFATVNILVAGSFEETYPRRRAISCSPPSVLVRPPGAPHLDRLGDGGARNLVLEVDDARLDSLRGYSSLFEQVRLLEDPLVVRVVRQMQGEVAIDDGASRLALEGLSLELLSSVARRFASTRPAGSPWLSRLRDLLHDRFLEAGLRMSDLSREVGVHPVHVARTFRAAYGLTPGQYLRRLRVDWAAEQIRRTETPLAEIALAAGFADQSHLSRVFKSYLGTTPAAWRRLHR